MNKNILNTLLAGAAAIGLASCGENTWNNHYLDGFEGGVNYDKPINGSYTLTPSDYEAISKLMEAKATTDAEKAAAKAIKTNLYFDKTGPFPAKVAIPAFCETASFPYYFASSSSTVDIVYAEADAVPAELTALAAAKTYTVSTDNYKAAWESDENYIKGFAPVTPASKYLPGMLTEAFTDATEGTYAVVTYDEASSNPVFTIDDNAPKVYINETFAEGMGEFTIDNVKLPGTSTYVWKHDTYNGDSYMKASGFVKGKFDSEGWLLSPEVKLSANANAVLTFEQAWKNFASVENAKVEATVQVREKGGEWKKLEPQNFPENTSYNFYPSGDISLAAYNGKTIQIGFCYKSTTESAGTLEVKNIVLQDGGQAARSSRALAAEVPTVTKNAVYYYNGSKWSVATGVSILNPADYAAMGVSNNKLTDPKIYLPMYLKNKLPYAQSDDQQFVVYNGTKADLFVFDGAEWTLNNNGLETVTGRYNKSGDEWSFVKYIGKATFHLFEESQIELDKSYLFVYGSICATPVDKGSSYGYLIAANVDVADGNIVAPTDANAFTFASSCTVGDKTVKAPEGKFIIIDSNNRYIRWDGSHASVNVDNAVTLDGEKIAAGYLWSATNNNDGSWSVQCTIGEETRTFYFSTKYNNFAAYSSASADDVLPSLFILE